MGVETGAAVRREPAAWWDGAISLGGDSARHLDQPPGVKVELGVKLGMGLKPGIGLKPMVRLKPGAWVRG